jgi:hypothetical protein
MKKLLITCLLAFAMMVSPAAIARYTFGAGNEGCKVWTEQRESKKAIPPIFEQWLAGYISAYNESKDYEAKIRSNDGIREVIAALDGACKTHPDRPISEQLPDVLQKRK